MYKAKKDCKLSYYDSLNTEQLLEQLSEAEKLTVLNSVTKEDTKKKVEHTDGLEVIKPEAKVSECHYNKENKIK